MARPLGLEPKTLSLEGKVNSAQALYLQSIYASFLRKSTPAVTSGALHPGCGGEVTV